ncbi:MAG: ISL3 family transposase [Ruminococcus sp.]|nr:ISL3 family transposase [Candidatus Copronaster equi]
MRHFFFYFCNTSIVNLQTSKQATEKVVCPSCGGKVKIYDSYDINLKDIPASPNMESVVHCTAHRYRCTCCKHTFSEEIPFKYPGTRITYRAANWIKAFLRNKLSIRSIQNLTGIHWDTIRKVQSEIMESALYERESELREAGYKPKHLAVDEFALHKGHSYATCVMDLDEGDIIWVGIGRNIDNFKKFFEETDSSLLSEVIAVAMDMNASYNKLVEKYLPKAQIVYDRYHMQAQFGRDVLGVVRLNEARKHNEHSKEILSEIAEETDKETKHAKKAEARAEKKEYSTLKKARWSLLMNSDNLDERRKESLYEILLSHRDLAICYSMKEEMCRLFQETDFDKAVEGWTRWFEGAKASGVPALAKFAQQKEKRLFGLAAYAIFPISTGKLEAL